MDVSDIFNIVDLHGFEDTEEADKVSVLNDVIQDICTREPWPFLEAAEDIDPATDIDADGVVTVPTDFTSLLKISNNNLHGRHIKFVRYDEHIDNNHASLQSTGIPRSYFFFGNKLHVFPVPSSGSFRLSYIRAHPELEADDIEADILLPARHHRLLAVGMIWRLHAQEDDAENATMFKSQYDEKMMIMRQDLMRLQWESPDSIKVFEWDYNADEY